MPSSHESVLVPSPLSATVQLPSSSPPITGSGAVSVTGAASPHWMVTLPFSLEVEVHPVGSAVSVPQDGKSAAAMSKARACVRKNVMDIILE